MPELTIAQLLQFQPRFLRSTHVERDFIDPTSLQGYVLTPELRRKFERIGNGLRPGSTQRAWRVTGDYGTGKSSFALALAHLVTGRRSGIPSHLQSVLSSAESRSGRLLPVLITGSREPIATAILRGLHSSISATCTRGRVPRVLDQLSAVLNQTDVNQSSDYGLETAVIKLLTECASYVSASGKGSGLLLILDELGKFLEYSALHPEEQDVYLMQRLAESASRSGDTPVLVVGLLHQGFNAYSDQLAPSAQREWEKVADRFEELIFEQPLEQTVALIADALRVKLNRMPSPVVSAARRDMRLTLQLKCYGADSAESRLVQLAERVYPLHPTVIPPLVRLFSKFGQNERSLFSFLFSSEPHGLKSFATRTANEDNFYRLSDLYDYARASFGHRLSVQTYRSHWNHIDSVISSFPVNRELDVRLLKTIGLLNLIDGPNVLPTEELLRVAVGGGGIRTTARRLHTSLEDLQKRARVVYKRSESGAYRLWSHTSLDLDRRYQDARRAVGSSIRVTATIRRHLETRPLVARRHYIQTGNLRHFEVRYLTTRELATALEERRTLNVPSGSMPSASADGQIMVVLCETENERKESLRFTQVEALRTQPEVLIAVTRPLNNLVGLVREALCWQWIENNTPELGMDPLASEEVSRMVATSRMVLQKRIHSFIGLQRHNGSSELDWFRMRQRVSLNNGREVLSFLSNICDEVYPLAPKFRNELVNRHQLSSAAAAARMRLIDRAFKHSQEPLLGMDPNKKPPEMSIYLSLLLNTGLHRQERDKWVIENPTPRQDVCNILPALNSIDALLRSKADERVKISTVFEQLRRPPLGVRDGISPILLAIYAIINEQHVAFYDKGAFMTEMSELDYMRLTKWPGNFEVQLCRFVGVRAELFDKLLVALQLPPRKNKGELLDIVRPLCSFVAQLSPYAQKTAHLSGVALGVRSALMAAREPGPLLFNQLPAVCGFGEFRPNAKRNHKMMQKFVTTLKGALDDLRDAYPNLLERLKHKLVRSFQLDLPLDESRKALCRRAEAIIGSVTEARLKTFCSRLLDQSLADNDWILAVGSVVVEIPPSKWKDSDEERFVQEIENLTGRFERVEKLTFERRGRASNGFAMRVAVTNVNGTERGKVIFAQKGEEDRIRTVQHKLESVLANQGRVELAALATVFWNALATDVNKGE